MLCRIAQWDWGHVAYAAGLEFVPQNSPIMHFNTTPTQSQPTSKPLFQSEAKCEAIDSHANKSHFHKTGFALGLFFKMRAIGTKKRSITVKYVTGPSYRNNAPRFYRIPAL